MKRPSTFSASIGGYFGNSYSVELRGERLRYQARRDDRTLVDEVLEPTADDWAAFAASLEAARIWSWERSYSTPGVMDGTSWSVSLELDGRHVESSGSNGFPGSFEMLTDAISRLVGGREFR